MQADLEGAFLCGQAWALAQEFRQEWPRVLERLPWFHLLSPEEMCAEAESGLAIDLTKLTLFLANVSEFSGSSLREVLSLRYDIQINKTTLNTALFMVNAGSTSSSLGHLITALRQVKPQNRTVEGGKRKVLPEAVFRRPVEFVDGDNDLRAHFYKTCESWIRLKESGLNWMSLRDVLDGIAQGRKYVSTSFVIPYPPGFPMLVPGQLVFSDVIVFLLALDKVEIHGLRDKDGQKLIEVALVD